MPCTIPITIAWRYVSGAAASVNISSPRRRADSGGERSGGECRRVVAFDGEDDLVFLGFREVGDDRGDGAEEDQAGRGGAEAEPAGRFGLRQEVADRRSERPGEDVRHPEREDRVQSEVPPGDRDERDAPAEQ